MSESTSELATIAQQSGLEQTKMSDLLAKFAEPFQQAQYIINESKGITVTSEDQKAEMEEARVARLELKRLRVDTEHTRKELKEQSLREGKAIDGMANIIKAMIIPTEEYLESQEKFAERLAAERYAHRCAERKSQLEKYVTDPTYFKYEDLGDEEFKALIQQLVDAKAAREEAERKAKEVAEAEAKRLEEERVAREKAAAAEAERMRKENEKLRSEAIAREAELAEQRAIEEKRQAVERAEQEKKLAAEQAKAAEERAKREAIEAEQRRQAEVEAKAKAQAEEEQRQALLAPDKEKLVKFADDIERIQLPAVANREAGKVLDETKDFLSRISKNLRQKATQL